MDEVLNKAAVVCATLSGALMRELRPLRFDLAVIDEAAQVQPSIEQFACYHAQECKKLPVSVNSSVW